MRHGSISSGSIHSGSTLGGNSLARIEFLAPFWRTVEQPASFCASTSRSSAMARRSATTGQHMHQGTLGRQGTAGLTTNSNSGIHALNHNGVGQHHHRRASPRPETTSAQTVREFELSRSAYRRPFRNAHRRQWRRQCNGKNLNLAHMDHNGGPWKQSRSRPQRQRQRAQWQRAPRMGTTAIGTITISTTVSGPSGSATTVWAITTAGGGKQCIRSGGMLPVLWLSVLRTLVWARRLWRVELRVQRLLRLPIDLCLWSV